MYAIRNLMLATTITLTACQSGSDSMKEKETDIIGKTTQTLAPNSVLTPEILYKFGRISGIELSPDRQKILYGVSYTDVEKNKSNRELFTMNIDGSQKKQITRTPQSEQNAVWLNDGKILFLSSESGNSQIWCMDADGNNRKQISHYENGIDGFVISPDNTKILFFSNIPYNRKASEIYPDLPLATGRVIDDLMYKHWDEWIESIPHPYVADFSVSGLTDITDIMEGEPYECPMKPFGGTDDFAWTPDSKKIAYTCRKKTGKEYAFSTNSDIFLYDTENKETKNLTSGMMGYDTYPRFSPDGRYMAWLSMEHDGYESDKNRLFIQNLESGEKVYLTEQFDYCAESFVWNDNNESIYFLAVKDGKKGIFDIQISDRSIRQVASGHYDYASVAQAQDCLIAIRHSISSPDEIFAVSLNQENDVRELSFENKELLDNITMGKVEERWIETTDHKKMLTWVVYPPHFDPKKQYPALLYCQGGPQSAVSQFWSYRWNLQLMAANGYIVVAPNRRGVPGFGQEWLEQISKDYGGQNMQDYFSAIDQVSQEPFVDASRLGAVGASYGGFSIYWLAGHHNKRFKAFIAHAGIFNLEQQYLETEEMWFAQWDLGGAFWDKNNPEAQRSYANSPHRFVDKWDTPILVTHGEKDYRILASQGMAAFNAATMRGIPAEMVIFPDENHWILQPQNGILWQRIFFRWLDKWLKPEIETSGE